MTNFSDMLSKAKAMQEKMIEAQDQIKKIEVEGEAGGNLVKVKLSGDYELKSIIISDAAKKESQEIVNMKFVEATFYFKDGTVLEVLSESGIYNNKTLDMKFDGNVRAKYEASELFAQKAEYSNSKSFLMISNDVKVRDYRGTMFADKLLFDIKKQTLNIASTKDGKINANVNLK